MNTKNFFLNLLATIAVGLLTTFVLMKLWLWVIVPTFHLIELSFYQSFGFMLFLNFIKASRNHSNVEEINWDYVSAQLQYAVKFNIIALVMGYVYSISDSDLEKQRTNFSVFCSFSITSKRT